MALTITWSEIGVRLLCTIAAGALLGLNRSERGHSAGLRTSLLVSLAACVAMLQVNLLLPIAGKASSSFVMMDLMRLPLGILSGIGFIGAGAIVRRDSLVIGVTTAATIWYLTVIGLSFGGGQIALGLVGTAIGFIVLAGLKFLEKQMKQDHLAKLLVVTGAEGPGENEIRRILETGGFKITSCALATTQDAAGMELNCDVHWQAKPSETKVPEEVRTLMARPGVSRVAWTPQAR
ncbi:MAG TPA: MgtC/SapB family protein [Bryobacteraceae bacterium]|nr:MgtC/SapB family protein [Bryobacteraceae bacterium]